MRSVSGSYQHAESWHIVGKESENSGIVFALSLTSLCVLGLVSSVWYGECFGGGRKLPGSAVSTLRSVTDLSLTICFMKQFPYSGLIQKLTNCFWDYPECITARYEVSSSFLWLPFWICDDIYVKFMAYSLKKAAQRCCELGPVDTNMLVLSR